jgi:hypothetical protein
MKGLVNPLLAKKSKKMAIAKVLMSLVAVLFLGGCRPVDSLNPLYTQKDLVYDPALLGTWCLKDDNDTYTLQRSGSATYKLELRGSDKDTNEEYQGVWDARLLRLGKFLFLDVVFEESLRPVRHSIRPESHHLRAVRSEKDGTKQTRFEPHRLRIARGFSLELVPGGKGDDFLDLYLLTRPRVRVDTVKIEIADKAEAGGLSSSPHLFPIEDWLFYLDLRVPGGSAPMNSFELHVIPVHWFFKMSIDNDVLRLAYLDDDWVINMTEEKKVSIEHERVGECQKGIVLAASTEGLQHFVLEHADDEKAFSEDHTLEFHRQR